MAKKINVQLILELRSAGMGRNAIAASRHISKNSVGDVFHIADMFFASTFSSKMQIEFLKVAWGISPVLHFLRRHSFRCRRGAVAGIQSLLVTDM